MRLLIFAAIFAAAAFQAQSLPAQSGDDEENENARSREEGQQEKPKKTLLKLNLPLKTAGGTQFWTDHHWRDGYRIQKNVLTGHFRLVDAKDVRRAWGTRDQCDVVLRHLCPPANAQAPGNVVVLLHGLMRSHRCMKPMEESLRSAGYDRVIRFSYASTQGSIDKHAAALCEVLGGLPTGTKISFVAHSMGNIVVRRALGHLQQSEDPHRILPRCQAMVMLGPPNQGAAIARRLAPTGLYGLVTGKGGLELGPQWQSFVEKLATPTFPFAIIAGDLSANPIRNPLVDASGDFVVSLEEAKLDGAVSFQTAPVLHSFLMKDEAVKEMAVAFLDQQVGPGKTKTLR